MWLSSKLPAFEKQLADHEVAVLELEWQVAVLELGENLKRLSDLVNETAVVKTKTTLHDFMFGDELLHCITFFRFLQK